MISIIAAMSKNRVIGKGGKLPWHLPADLKFFMDKTVNHVVIMGRKTLDSINGRPLPKRPTVVVTRQKTFTAPNCKVAHSVEEAIEVAKKDLGFQEPQELFILGGGEIYKEALSFTDRIYLTEVDATVEGDAYFPVFSEKDFKKTAETFHPADAKNAYSMRFLTFDRVS